MRVGVIGLGLIAQVAHLQALARLRPRIKVTYVADVAPGLAEQVAATVVDSPLALTDWRAMLGADRPDAVVICTPGNHARIAAECLAAGVSVLAEKPLCLTVAEAHELGGLAERHGVALVVGYMKSQDPITQRVAALWPTLTDPCLLRVTVAHPAHELQVTHTSLLRGAPLDDLALAEVAAHDAHESAQLDAAVGDDRAVRDVFNNVLCGSVVHEVALIRTIVGEAPTWTSVHTQPLDGDQPPSIHAVGTAGGVDVTVDWLWLPTFPDYEETCEIFAADVRITMSMEPPYTKRRTTATITQLDDDTDASPRLRSARHITAGYESSFDYQMAAFIDTVEALNTVEALDTLEDVDNVNTDAATGARRVAAEVAADVESLYGLARLIAAQHGLAIGGEAAR